MHPPVVVIRHRDGRRVYGVRRRVHHGSAGVALALVGAWLAWADRRDWREWWFREVMR